MSDTGRLGRFRRERICPHPCFQLLPHCQVFLLAEVVAAAIPVVDDIGLVGACNDLAPILSLTERSATTGRRIRRAPKFMLRSKTKANVDENFSTVTGEVTVGTHTQTTCMRACLPSSSLCVSVIKMNSGAQDACVSVCVCVCTRTPHYVALGLLAHPSGACA